MAKFHGVSGCTKIILDGMKPINGWKPETLDAVTSFYDNYFKIYNAKKAIAAKQQDDLIASLSDNEVRFEKNILEDIAKRKSDREAHIRNLHENIKNSNSILQKAGYSIQYLVAKMKSYQNVTPSPELLKKLSDTREQKRRTITYKLFATEEACKDLSEQRKFLDAKYSF